MNLRTLSYNGKSLGDFGVTADFSETFAVPGLEMETWEIPGRNGDAGLSNQRYSNVSLKFDCLIRSDFRTNYDDLIDFLTSSEGNYERLEYSADPNIFRMARFHSSIEPDMGKYNKWGTFSLVFDCMPQKFLKLGENKIQYSDAQISSLRNPTFKRSRPLLIVEPTTADGTITINAQVIRVTANNYRFYIDCELMHAYRLNTSGADVSMDSYVSMPDDYVELMPGENRILTNDAEIAIVPRWWRL